MKGFIVRVLSIILFISFSSVLLWHYFTHSDAAPSTPHRAKLDPANSIDAASKEPHKAKLEPTNSNDTASSKPDKAKPDPANSNDAASSKPQKANLDPANSKKGGPIDTLLENYTTSWKLQKKNFQNYRSLLGQSCDAVTNAVVTQVNSPVGSNITYDADRKKVVTVTPTLLSVFPKDSPFKKAPYDSCAVVGNGGILANSSCGEQIDSATFVIRCNLPPLSNGHEINTGIKTNLVTANPSIFFQKYQSLRKNQQRFAEDMQLYGDALLLLPAFSYRQNTGVSMRVVSALEQYSSDSPQPVFFNPKYLKSLSGFWRNQGIRSVRLSTGIMMVSLAMELCNSVYLYGFWPFDTHPYTRMKLSNHYYDNRPVNHRVHAMPVEFKTLLDLHNKGVVHLQLGECKN